MTAAEFLKRQDEVLEALPIEFREPVRTKAWEDGHASGYEEVLWHVQDLVEMLREPIAKFLMRQLEES